MATAGLGESAQANERACEPFTARRRRSWCWSSVWCGHEVVGMALSCSSG